MKRTILSVIALAATATFALAADDGSLPSKAMKDQPGTMGGSTDMPTAKPDSGSLADKAMKDQPGTK